MTGPKDTKSHRTDGGEELDSRVTITGKMILPVPRLPVYKTPPGSEEHPRGRGDGQRLRERKTDAGVSG